MYALVGTCNFSWALFSSEQVEVNTSAANKNNSETSGPVTKKAVDEPDRPEFDKENATGKVSSSLTYDCSCRISRF